MHYYVSFLVLQTSRRGRESWLLCNYVYVAVNVLSLPRGAVGWSAVCNCVFPDHTHLLFGLRLEKVGLYLLLYAKTTEGTS